MNKIWEWFMNIFKKHDHKPKGVTRYSVSTPDNANFRSLKIRIQIHGLGNFTEKEQAKLYKAVRLGNKVLNSMEFRDMVSNYTFSEHRGMTGKQIWEMICTGKDLYNPMVDNDIDVFVTMYENFWTGTIGYTFPETFKTWMNRKFFRSYNEAQILGNVLHEAMHNFGFDHKNNETKLESVPYKIGYFARDLCERIMNDQELTLLRVV